jgi:hypothetical protein
VITLMATTVTATNLFVCMGDLSNTVSSRLHKDRVAVVPLIDARFIDPDGDEEIDSVALVNGIVANYRDPAATGIGILDWEGKTFQCLQQCEAGDKRFIAAVNKYTTILRIAKATRPGVKWGVYYLPFTFYWQTELRKTANDKVLALLSQCDILLPSLYDYYPDSNIHQRNKEYHSDNMSVVLQIADKLRKPVYVFIWNRWHDSNADQGLHAIPVGEFKQHLDWITNTTYNGKKATGLIWFGADRYYQKQKPAAFGVNGTGAQISLDSTFFTYYDILKQQVNMKKR